jgi:hypothetical protein
MALTNIFINEAHTAQFVSIFKNCLFHSKRSKKRQPAIGVIWVVMAGSTGWQQSELKLIIITNKVIYDKFTMLFTVQVAIGNDCRNS